ncbi:hypothetical protein [Candidatus Tisiphia endosymbiont of Dioctria rufipes]
MKPDLVLIYRKHEMVR